MGVGGKFWDLLKPYARYEGFDYLRDKRVAVDLSFWVVQHETATNASVRKPHLRLTFFRAINLFSKFGAYPVFVLDGTPSPLKSRARIARFYRSSGIDVSNLPCAEDGISVERNRAFSESVRECVELLELLGMPVLQANGEAEALCAQLNQEGHVDACITPDSDAFLFGATCVIKSTRPNSREPFECYHLSDIEAGLGLKRRHLIAISLLVGNDFDLGGVPGIGIDTAVNFVRKFGDQEILDRLHDIGKRVALAPENEVRSESVLDVGPKSKKPSHCSFCGHPGSKRAHSKRFCELCGTGSSCSKKPSGFRCECFFCCKDREEKEQKKSDYWWTKVCNKISQEPNFPNDEIIKLYLCDSYKEFTALDGCSISWGTPNTEILVDFLAFQLLWEPSYIRRMMLPMLSTMYLREAARRPLETLLCGQYEFHSVHRLKVRYGHECYVVKWRKSVPSIRTVSHNIEESCIEPEDEFTEDEEHVDLLDGSSEPQIHVDHGGCFLLTDESTSLVQSAFPDEVHLFLRSKELRESKRKKMFQKSESESESPKSTGVQRSMTDFYRSIKTKGDPDAGGNFSKLEEKTATGKRKQLSSNLSKSVRRRLLFG